MSSGFTGMQILGVVVYYLAVIVTGGLIVRPWWHAWQAFKLSRSKFKEKGIVLRFFTGTWSDFAANTAGVPPTLVPRLAMGVLTIVVPAVCFGMSRSSNTPIDSMAWQSGPERYFEILLGRDVTTYFYPFALYSMLSALSLLIQPARFGRFFIIRFGIYSGTLLAAHFSALLLFEGSGLIVVPVGLAALLPYSILVAFWNYTKDAESSSFFWRTLLMIVWLLFLFTPPTYAPDMAGALLVPGMFVLIGSVCWVFPLGVWWSVQLWPMEKEWGTKKWLASMAWLSSYALTWVFAIARMFEIYNSLPTHPPDCYIATAAAQGHPRLVGSFATTTKGGQTFRLNKQLQHLKAAELILQALTPRLHRSVRIVYDVVGVYLAQKITHPAVATGVYWSLKPLEWFTQGVLLLLGRPIRQMVDRFYRG